MSRQNLYRRAQLEDAKFLSALERIRSEEIDAAIPVPNHAIAFWQERIARGQEDIYIAQLGGMFIGFAMIGSENIQDIDVFVSPRYRGQGVMHGLLEKAGVCCEPATPEVSAILQRDVMVGAAAM